jgi:hypothetical protein
VIEEALDVAPKRNKELLQMVQVDTKLSYMDHNVDLMFMGPCVVRYENHTSNQQDATLCDFHNVDVNHAFGLRCRCQLV